MLRAEYLRHQSDALLRLSQEAEKSEVSAKLQEMADEFRIMISVADVTSLQRNLNRGGRLCAGFITIPRWVTITGRDTEGTRRRGCSRSHFCGREGGQGGLSTL